MAAHNGGRASRSGCIDSLGVRSETQGRVAVRAGGAASRTGVEPPEPTQSGGAWSVAFQRVPSGVEGTARSAETHAQRS